MRPIDADFAKEKIKKSDLTNREKMALLLMISAIPTLDQMPNDPLTLEELRNLDYEPAWVKGDCETELGSNGWAMLRYPKGEKYICVWWPGVDFADIPSLDSYGDTWAAYRRKPEESEHDG